MNNLSKIMKKPVPDTNFKSIKDAKYTQLLSLSYFKTSFDYLIRGVDKTYVPTKEAINNGFTRLKDGSICYDASYRDSSNEKVEQKAKKAIYIKTIFQRKKSFCIYFEFQFGKCRSSIIYSRCQDKKFKYQNKFFLYRFKKC